MSRIKVASNNHRIRAVLRQFLSSSLPKLAVFIVSWITTLICGWILLIRLNDGIDITSSKHLLIVFIGIIAMIIGVRHGKKYLRQWSKHPQFYPILIATIVIIGVILRLLFLRFYADYLPKGDGTDTGIHWYTAQELLKTGHIESYVAGTYEAFFTQLTSYTMLIALSMRIFGINYLAILLPNILFDLVAALAVYVLLKKWRDRSTAVVGIALLLLNPLGIFFCAEGLALSVVNMFISLVMLGVYYLWRFLQQKRYYCFLLLSVGLGVVLSCGNAFRPIFSIFIIAIFLILVIYCLQHRNWRHIGITIVGFLVMAVSFTGINYGWDGIYRLVNPYYQSERHSMLGWNFFVGANYDTSGRWSVEDWNIISPQLYGEEKISSDGEIAREGAIPPETINQDFMQRGWMRYREMSFRRFALHFLNKSRILFGKNEITIIRNMEEQFTNVWGVEDWYQIACILALNTLTVFAILSCIYFIRLIKSLRSSDLYSFFLSLIFCGLFMSSLLVEVMSRYVVVFLIPFAIFSTITLSELIKTYGQKVHCQALSNKS